MLSVAEALKALQDGKKLRKIEWPEGEYFVMDKDGVFLHYDTPDDAHPTLTSLFSFKNLELYEEKPKIVITADDVGKRVRIKNGEVRLITGFNLDDTYPIITFARTHTVNGVYDINNPDSNLNIVEVF
jgi:hypothetical protein